MTEFENDVKKVLDRIHQLLVRKNKGYGNSALEPLRIFSKAGPIEQLLVRIDDKISRAREQIKNLELESCIGTIVDLIGYLVLLLIALASKESLTPKSEDIEKA